MTADAAILRALTEEDAVVFRELRLRALREDPVPFLASYEEEAPRTIAEVAALLRASRAGTEILGAFRGVVLVGALGFYRHAHLKARHRASLWGMYVVPEERRRGTGRALVLEAIGRLRAVEGIRQVELTVVATEEPARRLYRAFGFRVQGVLRRATMSAGVYFDEEALVLPFDDA
jgi:ribosomal protein S18 acetylase RimI-like enzyme